MAPTAGPRIDTSAPTLLVESVLKTTKMARDVERQRTIVRENKELLKKINQICRTKGFMNIDYNFRVHQSLNTEIRERTTRTVERQNRDIYKRIMNRKASVDTNLRPTKRNRSKLGPQSGGHRMVVNFWERSERWLCQLVIEMCPEVTFADLPVAGGRLQMFRIYQGTFVVLRSSIIQQNTERNIKLGTLGSVPKGSVLKRELDGREYFLVTLRRVDNVSDTQLLGLVAPGSMDKLELLNQYGSKYGRLREPIYFEVTGEADGRCF
ncbi:uncharacterized protein LOC131215510 [Anopheles bellator]|uniref:uncharacterized protein LOC131215510 n=1 Tax=Anopheles bellator TaxID=139047 RepID=UPI002649A149|nr:uncharacterized protein LOC131215510 [Anopheles bellator]